MKNTLVLCGGTGAHVALALVRLHTLGHALGFFRRDGQPLAFPSLYLVDQDYGDGATRDKETAWQRVRRFLEAHPGRLNPLEAFGRPDVPDHKIVTPLPVGRDRKWFEPPNDTVRRRFADSPWLNLLTAESQRDIRFSHGMMGSPAIGSLLFRLKELDSKQIGTNNDGLFNELLRARDRVVVVGSAIGGTGAAVGPTLSRRFAKGGANVMAVMVLNWFQFSLDGLDEATAEKAQIRNRDMIQNANSAFAYYGHRLARRVATVPVGIPKSANKQRRFTSDTQQPIEESFVHVVAALCGLRHFLDAEPYSPGLYQMGAENTMCLGGGNPLPGIDDFTVQELADLAATLAEVLDTFASTLSTSQSGSWFGVVPHIYEVANRSGAPQRIGKALSQLVGDLRDHLGWMENDLCVKPQPEDSLLWLTSEAKTRSRLVDGLPRLKNQPGVSPEDAAALALFHWTAAWIRNKSARGRQVPGVANGGYWPPLVGQDSLNVAAEHAGRLTRALDQDIEAIVQGFIVKGDVAQNGWPDPLAAADHFRYAIKHSHPFKLRQLEMLLAGVVIGKLTLRSVKPRSSPPTLSLDNLVAEARDERMVDLACVEIVYTQRDGDIVLGFNSPYTVLCPVPTSPSDKAREDAWGALWQALTGSRRPENWRTDEISEWRFAGNAIRQIRAWIEAEKRTHGGDAPPWTHIFEGETAPPSVPFGRGRSWDVYWGADPDLRSVRIALPTEKSGNYWPDREVELIPEDALWERIPGLKSVTTDDGVKFQLTEFRLPDRDETVRALWKGHLEELQIRGDIAAFGIKPRNREVALLTDDRRSASVLDNIVLLDRDEIMVRGFIPMRQEPVPGSSVSDGRILYPDYPLRSDFLGLVETEDCQRVLDLLKRGKQVPSTRPSIDLVSQSVTAKWTLRLAGCSQTVQISLRERIEDEYHRAHWMVWPRFRSIDKPFWRAYYVYEDCTHPNLHLSTLWLDPDDDRVRRLAAPSETGSHPIRFVVGDRRAHTGGPPVAFSLENTELDQELGLYVICLDPLGRRTEDINLGIDFGTSHTVASVLADGKKDLVELPPELDDPSNRRLTLHLSENWSHVTEPQGLEWRAGWLPTYVSGSDDSPEIAGLLPSELLTNRPLAELSADKIAEWKPASDCVIPFLKMQRRDLADHLLFDFKWEVSNPSFRGQESALREIYLGMVIELVMADVIWQRLRALPSKASFTFTYPLRTSDEQLESYRRTLRRLMESGGRSLGITLGLAKEIGIYDESSAAKGGTRRFGEVCVVGDLGGGTLDLFISANELEDTKFEEVADSVRIGGNELLRTMAEHPDQFLPDGWASQTDTGETHLRAWMRSMGAKSLFGGDAQKSVRHEGLNLASFEKASSGRNARELIERYFRLIVEHMARSLVAFLLRHWYPVMLKNRPDDHDKLRVLVQLRGNGWRLWHTTNLYSEIERKIAADIEARAQALWRDRRGDRDPWHGQEDLWRQHGLWKASEGNSPGRPAIAPPECSPEGSHQSHPKAAPIRRVVGDAQRPSEIECYSHALVQLALLSDQQSKVEGAPDRIRWFDKLPVETGGSRVKVEFHNVEPPFVLSHPHASRRYRVEDLEPELKHEINRKLEEQGVIEEVHYRAPIAALVWETAFKSKHFLRKER